VIGDLPEEISLRESASAIANLIPKDVHKRFRTFVCAGLKFLSFFFFLKLTPSNHHLHGWIYLLTHNASVIETFYQSSGTGTILDENVIAHVISALKLLQPLPFDLALDFEGC